MKITLFGLTLSSSWGNGHALPYRAILRALHRQGTCVTFFERDVPYYANHRDFTQCDYCELVLYESWEQIRRQALRSVASSDVVITASYCPEGAQINDEVLALPGPLHVFYDLDTPITLARLGGASVDYLRREQIPAFDLYLSFTGGRILSLLTEKYGAQMARPLYGCVDPDVHAPAPALSDFDCCLSYVGTYSEDRQHELETLFLQAARRMSEATFLLAGPLYPEKQRREWPANVKHREHVSVAEQPALYGSSRATLNLTRGEMAQFGFCPSGRFFEAAACGTPIFTEWWEGLDSFFDIGSELAVVGSTEEVLAQLQRPGPELRSMAQRARRRTLEQHTGEQRARELLTDCEEAASAMTSTLQVAP